VSVSSLRAVAAAALLTVLLAGCGGSQAPAAAPATTAAPTTSAAPAATTAPATTAAAAPVVTPPAVTPPVARPVALLPWPTTAPARLQAAVDGGATPWLLDPTELALSYVAATYGWTTADADPAAGTPAATKVDVRNTDGRRRALTVAQPGRRGVGGIWVVTADSTG
jgi:hypothetical protein